MNVPTMVPSDGWTGPPCPATDGRRTAQWIPGRMHPSDPSPLPPSVAPWCRRLLLVGLLFGGGLLATEWGRPAAAQEAADTARFVGDWVGTLTVGQTDLRVVMHVQTDAAGRLVGTMDSPDQGATGLSSFDDPRSVNIETLRPRRSSEGRGPHRESPKISNAAGGEATTASGEGS